MKAKKLKVDMFVILTRTKKESVRSGRSATVLRIVAIDLPYVVIEWTQEHQHALAIMPGLAQSEATKERAMIDTRGCRFKEVSETMMEALSHQPGEPAWLHEKDE